MMHTSEIKNLLNLSLIMLPLTKFMICINSMWRHWPC